MDDITRDFLVESNENLSRLDQEFVQLEKDPENTGLLASIFRTIHTIKGTAGFLNFPKLVSISHFAEDILAKMCDGKMKATPATIDALLAGVDAVKDVLATIDATSAESDKDYTPIIQRLKAIAEGAPAEAGSSAAASPARRLSIKAAVPAATVAMEAPSIVTAPVTTPPIVTAPVVPAPAKPVTEVPHVEAPHPKDSGDVNVVAAEAVKSNTADSTIRVEVSLLDRLMNLVGELVLTRNQILQFAGTLENKAIVNSSQRLNLITTELQENVMKTRMQPIGGVWNKLPRLVRDVSNSMSKEVDLHVEGAETELDKTILEAVKDPFTHIVRNAIDHGVESPDERVRKGKSRRGTIRLRAFHEGGQVNIEVADDGGGIDIQRVKRKAIQQRLITEEQAERMSEREAVNLIFRPGFSTAEKITSISGRGVGMDVVKTNIERIGGAVDVINNFGHGTTLKIKIPLTLAIIPALIVSANGDRFAIPQINLRELVRLEGEAARKSIEWMQGIEVYRLRGNLLPLIRLRSVLKLEEDTRATSNAAGANLSNGAARDEIVNIVVLTADNQVFGLVVDSVNDTEEIVVKPLKSIHAFAGSTIMGDGQVALILDSAGLLESADAAEHKEEIKQAEVVAVEQADRSTLLVFTLDEQMRFAMPLSMVSRLEEFQISRVERTNDGEVVQYRGQVMPLLRMASHVGVTPPTDASTLPVIVFSDGERSIGMVVHKLLDIVDESARPQVENKRPGIIGTAIVQGKTTVFVDPYALIEAANPGFFRRSQSQPVFVQNSGRKGVRKILLVDDSPFFRNLTRSYLEFAGYTVDEASNGAEALKRLSVHPVDFIISDIDMPQVDGWKLAEAIRANPELKHLPLIALSGLESDDVRRHSTSSGFDRHLVKIDREELLKAVSQLATERDRVMELASV